MKKPSSTKKNLPSKPAKGKDSGEVVKKSTLTPQKSKEKKNWKNKLDDEGDDDDFIEDVKEEDEDEDFDGEFEDASNEDGEFFDDEF